MTKVDYLVVGSGLTGATIARLLADAGRDVLVLERRNHLGGNVHDQIHEPSGIRWHTYGPHYFRTNSERIWEFVNRFADWIKFEAVIKTWVDGKLEAWPPTATPANLTNVFAPENFENACLERMDRQTYESMVKPYTEKQWGVPADELDLELASRIPLRFAPEPRLSMHKYQGVPKFGYTDMMDSMLSGIDRWCGFDYLSNRVQFECKRIIYTGPIDEYFGYDLGKLKYRGQKRHHEYHPNIDRFQPVVQCNEPSPLSQHIRCIEWRHLSNQRHDIKGTLLTYETPFTPSVPDQYEYPFPSKEQRTLYETYKKRVPDNVIICGRLGSYRYLDMDQAIARALQIAEELLR